MYEIYQVFLTDTGFNIYKYINILKHNSTHFHMFVRNRIAAISQHSIFTPGAQVNIKFITNNFFKLGTILK